MPNMRILKIINQTFVDGPGVRYSIYVAGCKHACQGCHNESSWNFNQGDLLDDAYLTKIINEIKSLKGTTGVTISGGDPFFCPQALKSLIEAIKASTNLNVWVYTGFCYEQIITNPQQKAVLEDIDVLVDGKFEMAKLDLSLAYRGSSNQRLIDVKQTLENGKITLWKEI